MCVNYGRNESSLTGVTAHLGIQETLTALSARTPCRFAAIFEVIDGHLVDRYFGYKLGEPLPDVLTSVPSKDSFCHLALIQDELRCSNSATDSRMDYSPYKGVMLACHAGPMLDPARALQGTLCVFDHDEATLSDQQFRRLVVLAKALPPLIHAERWSRERAPAEAPEEALRTG
jgi:hypothetical protein